MLTDCLVELLEDIRRQPPPESEDGWAHWFASVGQIIANLPRTEQRWAAAILVADQISVPGEMPLHEAYQVVLKAVLKARGTSEL